MHMLGFIFNFIPIGPLGHAGDVTNPGGPKGVGMSDRGAKPTVTHHAI